MEGRPADDSNLVTRAQRGDEAAYEEIVQRYQEVVFRTAYVITGSAADAEDAAQEGFVKAFGAIGRFRPGAPLRPWLLRIVANEARNRVRSSGRRHRLELRLSEDFRPGDAAPSPEAVVVATDERRRLLALVNGLGEEDRLVIAGRYLLELNGEETAAALGIPEGTVKSRLSRALARLKARAEEAAGASAPAGADRIVRCHRLAPDPEAQGCRPCPPGRAGVVFPPHPLGRAGVGASPGRCGCCGSHLGRASRLHPDPRRDRGLVEPAHHSSPDASPGVPLAASFRTARQAAWPRHSHDARPGAKQGRLADLGAFGARSTRRGLRGAATPRAVRRRGDPGLRSSARHQGLGPDGGLSPRDRGAR